MSSSPGGGVGSPAGSAAEKAAAALVSECDALFVSVEASLEFTAINEEGLVSMTRRLASKAVQLTKRSSSNSDALTVLERVNQLKFQIDGIIGFTKACTKYTKTQNALNATAVTYKFQGCLSSGVTIDLLPSCLAATRCTCDVFMASNIQHFDDAVNMLKPETIALKAPMVWPNEDRIADKDVLRRWHRLLAVCQRVQEQQRRCH